MILNDEPFGILWGIGEDLSWHILWFYILSYNILSC